MLNSPLHCLQLDPVDDEEKESVRKHVRNISSGDDLTEKDQLETEENDVEDSSSLKVIPVEEESIAAIEFTDLSTPQLTLQIPSKYYLLDRLKIETAESSRSFTLASTLDEFLTAEESFVSKSGVIVQQNNMSEEQEPKEETIPEESIFQRINSHKGMKSYQLGKQLSCKWSTGAGPRIGCLRDYPSGLQTHALEQVNLSPRSKCRLRFEFPSRASTPSGSNLSRTSSYLGCSSSL